MGGDEETLLALARIGAMLAGKAPLEKALKKCLSKMAQLMGIDSAGVYLLKENSTEMELVYTYGVSRRFAAAMASARIDRGIVGRVFKSGKPVALSRFSPRYPLAASIKKEGLKTIAYIPIRGAGKPRGILCLSNHKPYKFRRTALRLSLALGRQIGNAWEGSLVSGQAERRRSQLESLSRLSLEFGSVRSATQLFRLATRRAKILLKADWSGIRILEGDQLSLVAEADGRLGLKPSLRIGESLTGRVIRLKKLLAVPDMGTVSFQIPNHKAAVMRRGYRAFLGVPLKYRGQVMGVISVVERNAKEFSAEEISLLQGVAEQVGLAFHKLRLLEEKEILQSVISEIHLLDLQPLLDRLTQRIVDFLKADVSTVRLLDSSNQLTIQSVFGPPELVSKIRSEAFTDLVGGRYEWILKHRRPLLIADLQRDRRFPYHGSVRATRMRGFAGVPLIGRDEKILGLLTVMTLLPRRFLPHEIQFLRELASGASIAIEEAMLIDALSHNLRANIDFFNTVSHDLRTPLNVIVGNIDLIREGFFGPLTVEQQKRLQLLKRSSEDLLIMLNQVLSFSRIDMGGVELRIVEFNLGDFIEEVSAGVLALAQAKGLEFEWSVESDCSMRGDPHVIKEILYNLLTNAIKYTEKGVVSLRAALEPNGDQIRLEVTDTGRGIPEDELPFIFESFRQAGPPSAYRHGGVGLGLAIVKRLLNLLGGQIEVKSAPNEGSTFKVTLPRVFEPQIK